MARPTKSDKSRPVWARRIEEARLGMGVAKQADFAKMLGLEAETYRTYERGRSRPSIETFKKIEKISGKSFEWLIGGEKNSLEKVMGSAQFLRSIPQYDEILDLDDVQYARVGVFDIRVSAGPGCINEEVLEPESFNLYRNDWLKSVTSARPSQLAVVRVAGDSMWETLHDGDHVLVDLTIRKVGREGIYVIQNVGGETSVKRCQRSIRSGLITVASDNSLYPTEADIPDSSLLIIGRVIWLGRVIGV